MTKYNCEKCGELRDYNDLNPVENLEGELFFVCKRKYKAKCKPKKKEVLTT